MFQPAAIIKNTAFFNTAITGAVQTALTSSLVPTEIAIAGPAQGTASGETRRGLLVTAEIECISITPWDAGEFSCDKRNQSWYLTPDEIKQLLKNKFSGVDWQACFLVLAMADTEENLLSELQVIHAVIPLHELGQAIRRATAGMQHEAEKRFVAIEQHVVKIKQAAALPVFNFQTDVANSVAVAEAAGSDTAPGAMLSDFISRRSSRMQTISTTVQQAGVDGGSISYFASLSGEISSQLDGIVMPNQQAKMACLFAIGGTAQAVGEIKGALGL